MCGFDGIWRGNYFGEEPIRRTEVDVRLGKLMNGKVGGNRKDDIGRVNIIGLVLCLKTGVLK